MGRRAGAFLVLGTLAIAAPAWAEGPAPAAGVHPPSELIGTWRGTSTCTDREVAPACHDEAVIYDFTAGKEPGTVHWKADKVVDGERGFMGEFDTTYDADEGCWKSEYHSPRGTTVWCVVVDGGHLTGTARMLPGKQAFRKIDAKKD